MDMTERAAPSDDKRISVSIAVRLYVGDVESHAVYFLLSQEHHFLVVFRVGRDGTSFGILLQAAEA